MHKQMRQRACGLPCPTKEIDPPVVQRRTWEAPGVLADPGGVPAAVWRRKKARPHPKRSDLQSSTKLQQANSGCMRPELGRVLQ